MCRRLYSAENRSCCEEFLEVGSPCRIVVRSEGMALGVFTGSNQPAVRCFELHREGVCIRSGALATLTLVGETMRQD